MKTIAAVLAMLVSGTVEAQQTHRVAPETFWNTLDRRHPVVQRIKPGDIVVTRTIDATGYDEKDVRRAASGNPMTGPFYIEGAEPGDALVIHFRRIRLNRPTGWSGYRLGTFSLTPDAVEGLYPNRYKPDSVRPGRANIVLWDIDPVRATVRLRDPQSAVTQLEFPAQPMVAALVVRVMDGQTNAVRPGTTLRGLCEVPAGAESTLVSGDASPHFLRAQYSDRKRPNEADSWQECADHRRVARNWPAYRARARGTGHEPRSFGADSVRAGAIG